MTLYLKQLIRLYVSAQQIKGPFVNICMRYFIKSCDILKTIQWNLPASVALKLIVYVVGFVSWFPVVIPLIKEAHCLVLTE